MTGNTHKLYANSSCSSRIHINPCVRLHPNKALMHCRPQVDKKNTQSKTFCLFKRIFQMSSIGIISTLSDSLEQRRTPAKKRCAAATYISIAVSSVHPSVRRPCDMSNDLSRTNVITYRIRGAIRRRAKHTLRHQSHPSRKA